jgi:hypothetical protein
MISGASKRACRVIEVVVDVDVQVAVSRPDRLRVATHQKQETNCH